MSIASQPICCKTFAIEQKPRKFSHSKVLPYTVYSSYLLKSHLRRKLARLQLMRQLFFLSFFHFHLHRTLFRGLVGAFVNPGSFFSNSLFIHSLVCLITHSFLHGFQPNLYQYFSCVCFTCHTIISLK